MPGAEENREQNDQRTERQRHAALNRLAGEDTNGIGHRLNLQRQ